MRHLITTYFAVIIALYLTATSHTLHAADDPTTRPNIVLIFADDKYSETTRLASISREIASLAAKTA